MEGITEIWENCCGDLALFVDDNYIIYDKCDRLEAEIIAVYKEHPDTDIEEFKLKYYINGFRPCNNSDHEKDFSYKIEKYEDMIRRQHNE